MMAIVVFMLSPYRSYALHARSGLAVRRNVAWSILREHAEQIKTLKRTKIGLLKTNGEPAPQVRHFVKTMRPIVPNLSANTPATIPVFKLYSETFAWPTPDLMHCETIRERSQLHVWEIQQHRHVDLAQLLYVRSGTASMDVDGLTRIVDAPSLLVVPPMCVHGFRFSEDVEGYVLTIALPLLEWLEEALGANHPMLHRAGCYAVGADQPYIDTLCDAIDREYAIDAAARDLLLRSLVSALAVWLSRQALQAHAGNERPDRGQVHLSAFARLVEVNYRAHWPITHYCERLGITTAHLNTLCRHLLGRNALDVLHQRLLLEAKRNLIYTALPVSGIADLLGFAEAAYFTRFFKRLTGMSPTQFRHVR
ncbi:MAG: helix-turn-helix domain-containing protein [Janthinobacterium lividum]